MRPGHGEPFPLGLMLCVAAETCRVWSYMHKEIALDGVSDIFGTSLDEV